jgi:hypothetical protein
MKKIYGIVFLSSILLGANFTNPLPLADKAQENGGPLHAIDAYSDGIGAPIIDNTNPVDNSAMNILVYKYGEEAKANGIGIKSQVINATTNAPIEDQTLANKLADIGEQSIIEGSPCNDNNVETINDKILNGICAGTNVEGQACSDGNFQTIFDKYHNGVCAGVDVNSLYCDDNNVQTINDVYHTDGTCYGTNVEGNACNDNDPRTINDIYHNGICAGTNIEGQTCDDNNPQTISDIYMSGVCIGINVENTACNDNNPQTISDTYHNGLCAGTNVEGQGCDDNNAQTINDIYHNGICAGTNVEGQGCDDFNTQTINDIYHNGVCTGVAIVDKMLCDDGNPNTIHDIYTNGVCGGIVINYFVSPNGNNSNSGSYDSPLLDFTNIPSGSTVAMKNGTYSSVFAIGDDYTGGMSVFKGLQTNKSNIIIYGESRAGVIINVTKSTARDIHVIPVNISTKTVTNIKLINATVNYNVNLAASYSSALSNNMNNGEFDNITFNLMANYSLNYDNDSGTNYYNNCSFNGGNKQSNYNGGSIIKSTSSYPSF